MRNRTDIENDFRTSTKWLHKTTEEERGINKLLLEVLLDIREFLWKEYVNHD